MAAAVELPAGRGLTTAVCAALEFVEIHLLGTSIFDCFRDHGAAGAA